MEFLEQRINSVELCELINMFRVEEKGDKAKKYEHYDLMKKIRKELETMEKLGLDGHGNISLSSYINSQNKEQPCYSLNASGMRQILNSESTYVRCKTEEYIAKLEKQNKQLQTAIGNTLEKLVIDTINNEFIRPLEEKVNRLEGLVGIRSKTVFDYSKYIKLKLGIRRVNDDYKAIKLVLFHEFNVTKWEELNYSQDVISRIDQLCESYNPRRQRSLFEKR